MEFRDCETEIRRRTFDFYRAISPHRDTRYIQLYRRAPRSDGETLRRNARRDVTEHEAAQCGIIEHESFSRPGEKGEGRRQRGERLALLRKAFSRDYARDDEDARREMS